MRKKRNKNSEAVCLPEELWTIILARLPTKTLIRFRLVCKSWCLIIDNTDFVSMHLNLFNNNQNNDLLTVERTEKNSVAKEVIRFRHSSTFKSTSAKTVNLSEGVMVRGYANGVLLIDSLDSPFILQLWNPSIKKTVSIPGCSFLEDKLSSHSFSFSFGFDSLLHDCKVVWIKTSPRLIFSRVPNSIQIYSLSTGLWKTKLIEDVGDWWLIKGKPLFAKGSLNWLARDERVDNGSARPTYIASFDLNIETFTFIKLPEDGNGEKEKPHIFLFLLGGLLALFDVSPWKNSIWVMENNGPQNPWIKWFTSDSPHGSYDFFQHHGWNISHLCYIEKTSKFFMLIGRRTKSYDLKNHLFDDLRTSNRAYMSCMDPYSESLLLHNLQ
ncbi:F-box protein At1g11270-like [Spinacia oleracea]|uniref:F-box protein At1g11270-like n=1 Tax=Spinacia oleracea TaxID=3562 RepID=A0A9R0IG08_SPIOL|nr:F-box protein At1g11270-like [Spinacia oleracea]